METRKFFVPLALILIMGMFTTASFGCFNIPSNQRSDDMVKEERAVSNFTRLDIGGAFQVYLSQGDEEKLVVEADAEEIKDIVTEVTGSKLKIYYNSKWAGRTHQMNIYLTFKTLDDINFSGAVEVKTEGTLKFADLDMDISGAAEIDMTMDVEKFSAEFSGASELDFKGTCKSGNLELSGASELNAQEFECDDLYVEVSGASEAKVWATGTLKIDASGASEIKYKGQPQISIDQSGASSVKPM